MIVGMWSSLQFKWFRFFTHSAITETCVIFIMAMTSYFLAEMFELSGLISLVTCGITMGQYTWYNLSPQGKSISSLSVSVFGAGAESMVFAYIGLSLFAYSNEAIGNNKNIWSYSFIGYMLPILAIGRLLSVYLAYLLFRLCSSKNKLNLKQLTFIAYGGMIRGAIAFGLVLRIPKDPKNFPERDVFVTSTLSLVIITTIVFGSFMPLV